MIGRVLCWLGLHRWRSDQSFVGGSAVREPCGRPDCHKARYMS